MNIYKVVLLSKHSGNEVYVMIGGESAAIARGTATERYSRHYEVVTCTQLNGKESEEHDREQVTI